MNIVLGVPVLQGFGLTETCAAATLGHPDDRSYGRVGPPVPSCEIKLRDVPDMNYLHTDKPNPRGEILVRGGPVTKGYYKLEDKTAESFIEDGDGKGAWFMTGDIGAWHPDGTLQIIDRKKDLVKMVQGEYIALGRLEAIYGGSPYVANICVYADSLQDAPLAAVLPNEKALEELGKTKGVQGNDLKTLCESKEVIAEVQKSLDVLAKQNNLHRFEYLKAIILCPEEWTPANGLLTEAMKLKRKPLTDKYKNQFDELYKRNQSSA